VAHIGSKREVFETDPAEPAFFTIAEVMAWFRITRSTAYRLISRGQLRGCRIGRSWRISRLELMRITTTAVRNTQPD